MFIVLRVPGARPRAPVNNEDSGLCGRHSRAEPALDLIEGRNPGKKKLVWIPAFAGMTDYYYKLPHLIEWYRNEVRNHKPNNSILQNL